MNFNHYGRIMSLPELWNFTLYNEVLMTLFVLGTSVPKIIATVIRKNLSATVKIGGK